MASKTGHSPEMSWVKTGEGGRGQGMEQLTESVVSLSFSSMRPDIDEVEMRKNACSHLSVTSSGRTLGTRLNENVGPVSSLVSHVLLGEKKEGSLCYCQVFFHNRLLL